MNRKKLRQIDLALEGVQTQVRPAADDLPVEGIGDRRLQLIVIHQFQESHCWELRKTGDDWLAYRSKVIGNFPPVSLQGYERLPMDSEIISDLFRQWIQVSIPLEPDLRGMNQRDGTLYQLTLFGDLFSECRIQWWEKPPPQWLSLADLANEMIALFSAVK